MISPSLACQPRLRVGKAVKVTLDQDNRCALISTSGGQVGQGTEQVGQLTRRGTAGVRDEIPITFLLGDGLPDRLFQGLPRKFGKFIVSQVFQFQFTRLARQAVRESGGDHRVRQLPNFADGILEGPVPIDHDFHLLAGPCLEKVRDGIDEDLARTGKELDFLFAGLVAAEEAVAFMVAAAIPGFCQKIIQAQDPFGPARRRRRFVLSRVWTSHTRT